MTVHTAKGLEYPVVFVAGLEESIFPHANSMFDPSGLEEERRLAYVAITRARERLYLTHAHARSIYGTTQHNPASRFVAEIPAERVEASGVGSLGVSGSGWEKRGDRRGTSGHGTAAAAAVRRCGRRSRVRQRRRHQARVAQAQEPPRASRWATSSTTRRSAAAGCSRSTATRSRSRFDRTGETKKLLVGYAPIVKIKP